jgi:excisionase family DNA binding protein
MRGVNLGSGSDQRHHSQTETEIVVRGRLLSNETIEQIVKGLLVPLLAEKLLEQQHLSSIGSGRVQHLRDHATALAKAVNAKLLTVDQAAKQLGMSPATIRAWIGRRKIPFVRLGRCVRISVETIDGLIESNSVPASQGRNR